MEWVRFDAIERYYGARPVLHGASGVLRDSQKIGLVGINGSGKSTLLKLLAGIDTPDAGSIARARGTRIGYVSQELVVDAGIRLRNVMESAFAMVRAEEHALRELEHAISDASRRGDPAAESAALKRYADAREEHERHGGAGFERRMRSMLAAFGFSEHDLDKPIDELSGGQRTRASIARVLLEDPDYLLLDEPTNHLDIEATRFLEDLISRDVRAMILVSHDRYVLDRVADTIWELEGGRIRDFPSARGAPAYTSYVDSRARADEEAQRLFERSAAERKRRQAVIAELRTHGSHNYAQVRSREKQLAKFAMPDAPKSRARTIGIRLTTTRRAGGGHAVRATGLAKSYGSTLFAGLDLDVARGERIAVVGPNGAGKSTLLKILAGEIAPDAGTIEFAAGVRAAYFSQEARADLSPGLRAVDAVMGSGRIEPQRARALLGRMGLGGEHADKPVESFSGGERRRIMLARLMARETDCLLLDEPTNDLDIASREALESALDAFEGAMLVVSHDRYLLRRVADRVLALRDGEWSIHAGGYDIYEASMHSVEEPAWAGSETKESRRSLDGAADDGVDQPLVILSKNKRASLERELAQREAEIERLEARRAQLEREYADPELYADPTRVKLVQAELEAVRTSMELATGAWEHVVDTLNAAQP